MCPDSDGVRSAARPQLIAMNQISADDLELEDPPDSVPVCQLILSAGSLSPTCAGGPAVVEGQITLNNCSDVHIGHKYENSGDIFIHQNISVINEGESLECLSDHCRQIVVRDILDPKSSSKHHKLTGVLGNWFGNNRCVSLMVIIFISLFFAAIVLFLHYKYKESNHSSDTENLRGTSINSAELEREYPHSLKFVWRDAWGAAQPTSSRGNNSLPVERIIMCHSASQGTCNKFTACKQRVLSFQELHMDADHDYGDIGYNFVIGGDGYIYVGRGWDQVGAHTRGYNYNSLGVAFVGDFRIDELNDNMMRAAETLVGFGVKLGKVSEHYQVYGHCQVLESLPVSPGRNVMKFIRTWSHWNDTNLSQCKG